MKAGKSQVKVVETIGSRTRLNILGALNLQRIEDTVIREYPVSMPKISRISSGRSGRLTRFRKKSILFCMGRVTTEQNW
ncbi:hypothetical protein XIS1_140008 [Xenorhabdus innexi]|uniref:Uncharacterized protein n=1 Tax=Xenorhabdus innexi TaxID=290109 RepID=A0A1N6MTU7_9GAMM|nr:hypothetical protein XIS1_140008 [Xenorhabdus innexi]